MYVKIQVGQYSIDSRGMITAPSGDKAAVNPGRQEIILKLVACGDRAEAEELLKLYFDANRNTRTVVTGALAHG